MFVRFCEDTDLVPQVWLGGPEPGASADTALRNRQAYLMANPRHNGSEWLRDAFGHLRRQRATAGICRCTTRRWTPGSSATCTRTCRRTPGRPTHRGRPPRFIVRFILSRTLDPALDEFGLAAISAIDPTCGSGHFMLELFDRLLALWKRDEPNTDIGVLVERALAQVHGVDLNPAATAIARFRLVIAALHACGRRDLNNVYPVRVATGDSLLDWGNELSYQGDMIAMLEDKPPFAYFSEDAELLAELLRSGTHNVVVGNPPYITVKDKALNDRYRKMKRYDACSGKYALSVPFAQRFFDLT